MRLDKLVAKLERVGPGVQVEASGRGLTVSCPSELVLPVAKTLFQAGYHHFLFVTAVDTGEDLQLAYRVNNVSKRTWAMLKTAVDRTQSELDSVVGVWPGADWHERETFDLFGVVFRGHPGLKRILMPDDWVGHPLRKDYKDPQMERRPDFI